MFQRMIAQVNLIAKAFVAVFILSMTMLGLLGYMAVMGSQGTGAGDAHSDVPAAGLTRRRLPGQPAGDSELPKPWMEIKHPYKVPEPRGQKPQNQETFYHNPETEESQWERPLYNWVLKEDGSGQIGWHELSPEELSEIEVKTLAKDAAIEVRHRKGKVNSITGRYEGPWSWVPATYQGRDPTDKRKEYNVCVKYDYKQKAVEECKPHIRQGTGSVPKTDIRAALAGGSNAGNPGGNGGTRRRLARAMKL